MSDPEAKGSFPDDKQRVAFCESQYDRKDKKGKAMPAEFLRAGVIGKPQAVDRIARALKGYVAAQDGPFKTPGRGAFNEQGLREIVRLGNAVPMGLKSRLGHPTMSDDGIGKFLGRAKNFRMDKATNSDGKMVKAVRGDLYFDPTSHSTPHGDLATYVMNLAESDPDALSSSLVLARDAVPQLDAKGKPLYGDDDEPLPDLWMPTKLHASDLVDTGDAVDSLLSAPELAQALSVGLTPELEKLLRFDNVARLSTQLLDGMFRNMNRDDIEARCQAWLRRYLAMRFEDEERRPTPALDSRRSRIDSLNALAKKMS